MDVSQPARTAATIIRRRSLGSDHRAGAWARGRARRTQYAFMRRHWAPLAAFGVFAGVIVWVTVALTQDPFARGFIVGAGLVGTLSALWLLVVQASGTAPTMMGDLGEQWTAHELRRLRRDGWRLVNHVTLRTPDIDHVLIGPGGVFAIETKWSANEWKPDDRRIVAAANTARDNARLLTLWRELKSLGIGQVRAAVFLWGEGSENLAEPFEIGGTTVVPGPRARLWQDSLGHDQLSPEQVESVWRALDVHCRKRDPFEAEIAPLPLSLWEWGARVLLALTAACAGFLAAAAVASSDLALPWASVCWALMVAAGVLTARIPVIRYMAIPWTVGVVVVVATMGAAYLLDALVTR